MGERQTLGSAAQSAARRNDHNSDKLRGGFTLSQETLIGQQARCHNELVVFSSSCFDNIMIGRNVGDWVTFAIGTLKKESLTLKTLFWVVGNGVTTARALQSA